MELAGRNLREALLRNSLTTLGIAVGVASLVAFLSLGIGLQTMAMTRLQNSGLFNRVYVTPRPIGGSLRAADEEDAGEINEVMTRKHRDYHRSCSRR